jgi:hypothetical protein
MMSTEPLESKSVAMSLGRRTALSLAFAFTLAFTGAALLPATVVRAQNNQDSQQTATRDDDAIQSDVAYALLHSQALQGQRITADTNQGEVTLSGSARDEASRELAETLVARVNGVRAVHNTLRTGTASAAPPPGQQQPADQQAPSAEPQDDPASRNMAPADPNYQPPADQQGDAQQPPPPDQQQQAQPDQQPQPAPNAQQPQAQAPPPDNGRYPRYPRNSGGYPPPPDDQRAQQPTGPVTLPIGTLVRVRISEPIDTGKTKPGTLFQATVANDVYAGQALAVPRGAVIQGKVIDISKAGATTGHASVALNLNTLTLGGQSYPLATDNWTSASAGKGAYTAGNTVGGAALGAIIGGIVGRGPGAAIGAVAGGATGVAASAATPGPRVVLPPESMLTFHLTQPITVTPVSWQEARRLAASAPPPGPALYRRGPYGYPPPPPYYYPYPYYGRVYYAPRW